jgi:CheY-like chemotaxis protein
MNVLAIDDDTAGLEIRRLVIERRGHRVSVASNVSQAREQFQTRPDVVVLDLRIPDAEDGLSLIREFHSAAPSVRIVALCGNRADLDGRPEAAMVDQILGKPARSEQLMSAIESATSSYRPE